MNTPLPKFPEGTNWRELYRLAILELEPSKLPQRIAEAEGALIGRAKELFQDGGDNGEETEDLDDAMYALRGLRSTLKYNPTIACTGNTREAKVA